MHVVGIIAEYNPLHNGHLYHIRRARELSGCDYVIVAMSGDFVQRGEPALADKYTRAEWALQAGADIVLELPTACAVSSAERFAFGGVRVLAGTGVVNTLCFGSENADIDLLRQAAQLVCGETQMFRKHLKEQLALGKSYPRARYDALKICGAPENLLDILRAPNSILGVEYLRFMQQLAPQMQALSVARVGAGYNEAALTGEFSSATAIREAMLTGQQGACDCMPMYVAGRFALGIKPVSLADAETLMLYALRRMSLEECANLVDVQEGFENVIRRAAMQAGSLSQLFASLKTKRYTMARCKRIALCALLGLTSDLALSVTQDDALYLRVLGFRNSARLLLSAMGKQRNLPLIMRRSDTRALPPTAQALLAFDEKAHSIYGLLQRPEPLSPDFARPPVTI